MSANIRKDQTQLPVLLQDVLLLCPPPPPLVDSLHPGPGPLPPHHLAAHHSPEELHQHVLPRPLPGGDWRPPGKELISTAVSWSVAETGLWVYILYCTTVDWNMIDCHLAILWRRSRGWISTNNKRSINGLSFNIILICRSLQTFMNLTQKIYAIKCTSTSFIEHMNKLLMICQLTAFEKQANNTLQFL